MTDHSFTVETFNGHDTAAALRSATFLGLQERGKRKTYTSMTLWLPTEQEGLGWNPLRFVVERRGRVMLHTDGVSYGHPNTTPERWALYVAGRLDGHRLAVIDTHLVNNAFGVSLRGERHLRRKLWRLGWRKVQRLKRDLEGQGYPVIVLGDLNRTLRFWHKLNRPVISSGFDHIFYPPEIELLESWTGDPNGSDHKPLFGRFRFKATK